MAYGKIRSTLSIHVNLRGKVISKLFDSSPAMMRVAAVAGSIIKGIGNLFFDVSGVLTKPGLITVIFTP